MSCLFALDTLKKKKLTVFRDVSGGALDTVEKLLLKPGNLNNFMIYDGMGGYFDKGNFWHKRLPWPLFDITTVKIPVQWLPKKCYHSFLRKRKADMKVKEDTLANVEDIFDIFG